jgi:hypothetical protein
MANTATQPVALTTFISQIDQIIRTTKTGANGAVMGQVREPSQWDEMVKRIQALGKLQEDWDGLGAKAPQGTLIESAVELAQSLRQQGFRPPSRVGAGPDGEILLEWQDERVYLEAEVCTPHSAEWLLSIDDQTPKHWVTR